VANDDTHPKHNINRDRRVELYRTMRRIRAFEEAAEIASLNGQVGRAVRLSIGQEAIAAGACANPRRADQIIGDETAPGQAP
jgi:TPP-dependent pyruvate/acetoin dehydrogenase alpha subunit